MAVIRDDELVRDFVGDGSTAAAASQHDRTLERQYSPHSLATENQDPWTAALWRDRCGFGGKRSIAGDAERGDDVTAFDHGGARGVLSVLAVAG